MVRVKTLVRGFLLIAAGLAILIGPLQMGVGGPSPGVRAASCWQAEITEQWTAVDLAGSVLRVSVAGQAGLPVTVRSPHGFQTENLTGTKPEYGPYAAEFAPLSLGTYFIEPQGLGVVFEVWLDGKNYTRVDFTPQPCALPPTPTATTIPSPAPAKPTVAPQPTAPPVPTVQAPAAPPPPPPPQPATGWQGRVVQHLDALEGRHFATIAVRVIGRPAGQEVEISSNGWSANAKTGTKPEHGPDACEFGALNEGTYRLTPLGLDVSLDVIVGLQDFVLVEFTYVGGGDGSSGGPSQWVGSVVNNTSGAEPTGHVNSAIAVIVNGRPWHEVEIRSNGWSSTCTTGYKPQYGPDACEFGALRAAIYTIVPKDLGASAQVMVDGWGWAMVRFDQVAIPAAPPPAQPPAQPTDPPAPPAPTAPPPTAVPPPTAEPTASPQPNDPPASSGWQGWVINNGSGQGGTGVWSVIIVRVVNWGGILVHISGGGGWNATCITGTKAEYGPDACEFGGLWPGIYYLQPEGSDFQLEVEMDGIGTAEVHFAAP